jgi:hypothetical protein
MEDDRRIQVVNFVPPPWTPISEVESGIFLGGIPIPQSDPEGHMDMNPYHTPHHYIANYGVRVIISITDVPVQWNIPSHLISYSHIVILDRYESPISTYFWSAACIIRQAKKDRNKILVHCHAGISRSTAILAAYYLFFGIPQIPKPKVDDVLNFIRSKRPFINPNAGFLKQLEELYRLILYGAYDMLIESQIK